MRCNKLFYLFLFPLTLSGCFENHASQLNLSSCPAAKVNVLKVSYNEGEKQYFVFHTALPNGENLANPLKITNLQMAQIPFPQGSKTDSAFLNFQKSNNSCNPVLEMTQGFKIELASGNSAGSNQQVNSEHSSGGGSYWTPFLMGAMVGHTLSGVQPRYASPTYYAPPPTHIAERSAPSATAPRKSGFFSSNRTASSGRGGFFRRRR